MGSSLFRAAVLGFILGLGSAEFFRSDFLLLLAAALLILLVALRERKVLSLALFLIFFFGAIPYQAGALKVWQREWGELPPVGVFRATISSFPELRNENLIFKVRTQSLLEAGEETPYRVSFLIQTSSLKKFSLGDRLELYGRPRLSREPFYLAKEKVAAELSFPEIKLLSSSPGAGFGGLLKSAREQLESLTQRLMPSPAGEFLLALFIGGSHRLPLNIRENFLKTGTQHIMAVSGFNTTLIAFAILVLARRLSRNLALFLTFLALLFFTFLTGASPSVVRAALMTSAYLVGILVGRPRGGFNLLLLAAFLMLLLNPLLLRYDLGFQLSFLSTYGLMIILPRLLAGRSFLPLVGELAGPGLVAFLMTWPIIALTVGRVSLIAVLANALVTPLIPLAMLGGFLTLLLGAFYQRLALLLLPLSWGVLSLILFLVKQLASLPVSLLTIKLPFLLAVFYYLLLALVIRRLSPRWRASPSV